MNASAKGQYETIYYLHKVACKACVCFLPLAIDESTLNDIEELINGIIQSKKNESMNNRIIY